MNQNFTDYFSKQSAKYAKFRPGYPQELFDFLTKQVVSKNLVWDCGTGSGQAAVSLANLFTKVIATDASAEQIKHARERPNIEYKVALADASGLKNASVDLITVANAVHWFDIPKFFGEAKRVLKPNGVIAIWCYNFCVVDSDLKAFMQLFYEKIKPFWAEPVKLAWNEYKDIEFPFREIKSPQFSLEKQISLDECLGYYSTWSSVQAYKENCDEDPILDLKQKLEPIWGAERLVRWPLYLRVGKI
jgi:ubiquinone/menaquinone biosynthesis C-methylase UbiE